MFTTIPSTSVIKINNKMKKFKLSKNIAKIDDRFFNSWGNATYCKCFTVILMFTSQVKQDKFLDSYTASL